MRQRNLIGAALAAIVIVLIIVFVTTRGSGGGSATPADETAFINGMNPIMTQVTAGGDLDSWRQKRAALICQVIPNLAVTNWVGTVDKLDTTIAGGGIVSIAVMPNVDFGTAPNSLMNLNTNTVISPGSNLFHTLSTLQVGQKVTFSGQLFSSQTDCIQEASVTSDGSMQNPLFLIRFTSITPQPQPNS